MAQPLVLQYCDKNIGFHLTKIDRSSLYGFVETEIFDQHDRKCRLVTLAGDGRTLVGTGGTAIAYISQDGQWCNKKQLKAVNLDGDEIEPVPSTFKSTVILKHKASIEEYLEHQIRSVYLLSCDEVISDLEQELKSGTIYSFPFSYRGALEADPAFLLANRDSHIFLAVGKKTNVNFVGFEQVAGNDEDDDDSGDDDMDFGMM